MDNGIEQLDDVLPPGERLRRARLACDLSLNEVATHLKLSVEKIESLERGEVTRIAAPVFVSGYLKAYAKLVNLSGDEIVSDFDALTTMDAPSMNPLSGPAANNYGQVTPVSFMSRIRKGGGDWGWLSIMGSLAVVLFVVAYVVLSDKGQSKDNNGEKRLAEMMQKENVPNQVSEIKHDFSEQKKIAQIEDKMEDLKVASLNDPLESIEPVAKEEIQTEIISSAEQSELAFYFNEDSWVEVTDAQDRRLLFRLGKSGMSQTVTGIAPFSVRLGYVNGVTIMLNGEPYDLSHYANRRSVRFQIGKAGDRMSRTH